MNTDGSKPRLYQFGVFDVNQHSGELLKKGVHVRLQQQPFNLLIVLLESAGEVVSKDTLRHRLWPDDTFVEFDSSLSVAVGKLREALGDDAGNPRFIETLPRRGYRFIAPARNNIHASVSAISSPASAAPEPVPLSAAAPPFPEKQSAHSAAVPAGQWTPPIVASLILGVIFAVALSYFLLGQHRPDATVSVIVGDFANTTSDPVFAGSLRRAVIMQLAQSPFFQIPSDARIEEALQRLGRPPEQRELTQALVRQVCQPVGANVTMDGAIMRMGAGNYLVSIDANRCGDGDLLTRAQAIATGRDQVLPALGQAIEQIRKKLGESKGDLKQFNVPIEQATTDSIDALKAYRVALELRRHGKYPESIPVFRAAIALDPNFAMAYAHLGSIYSNLGEGKMGAEYLKQAFNLRQRTTEPERFYIAGRYFDIVTGELEKALEHYSLWHQAYSQQWSASNAIANDANLLGRYEIAIPAAKNAMRLEPNHTLAYSSLATALLGANRFAEAQEICEEAIAKGHDSSAIHRILYTLAFMKRDGQRMHHEVAQTSSASQLDMIYVEAEAAMAEGQIGTAKRLFEENIAKARAAGLFEYAGNTLGREAVLLTQMGMKEDGHRLARAALVLGHGDTTLGEVMAAYAIAGDQKAADKTGAEYDHAYPMSVFNMGVYTPSAKAALAHARHTSAQEIKELMAPAHSYELGQRAKLLPVYVRAQALLERGSAEDAAREFQMLLDHPGVDPVSPYLALAHLGLARSWGQLANREASCTQYREFLYLWQSGDPDVPILRDAKRESAAYACPS